LGCATIVDDFNCRGDHTTADCDLVVVPPHTEAVVFSVDGSFAANISISAKDVKVKDGAVDVVRLETIKFILWYVCVCVPM